MEYWHNLTALEGEAPHPPAAPLSGRQVDVLQMTARGRTNKEIGQRLGIREHTVKAHMTAIFLRLGARTRAHAVALGIKRGLIEP